MSIFIKKIMDYSFLDLVYVKKIKRLQIRLKSLGKQHNKPITVILKDTGLQSTIIWKEWQVMQLRC